MLSEFLSKMDNDFKLAEAAADIMLGISEAKWEPSEMDKRVDYWLLTKRWSGIESSLGNEALPWLTLWAKSKNPEMSNRAVMAISHYKTGEAGDILFELIDIKNKDARFNAISILKDRRDYRVMKPLINKLATDTENKTRYYIILKNWTKQDFGFDVEKWLDWWEANKAGFDK